MKEMNSSDTEIKLEYNTEREKLRMPEYGRNVLKMVEDVMAVEDRDERSRQAAAIVKVMGILNPQVHQEENWEHKMWDHLFIISDFKLDVDSPYPMPSPGDMHTEPMPIPLQKKPVKASHYGRNIESIIDLTASLPEGEQKTAVIRALANYMRTQYLIWNKDSVADETIFNDIEKLSDYRLKVPEGVRLSRVSSEANFSKPGMNMDFTRGRRNGNMQKHGRRKNFQKGR